MTQEYFVSPYRIVVPLSEQECILYSTLSTSLVVLENDALKKVFDNHDFSDEALCGELCDVNTHDHSAYDPSILEDLKHSGRAVSYMFRSDEQCPTIGCGPRVLGRAVRAVK